MRIMYRKNSTQAQRPPANTGAGNWYAPQHPAGGAGDWYGSTPQIPQNQQTNQPWRPQQPAQEITTWQRLEEMHNVFSRVTMSKDEKLLRLGDMLTQWMRYESLRQPH